MHAGLIQPDLLEDGQVCVDMGEPILEANRIPTTLPATQVSGKLSCYCVIAAALAASGDRGSGLGFYNIDFFC